MKVFIQGMRRSGTTILFDALSEDAALDAYYEPFAAANRSAFGGGSGARPVDYFEKIRMVRDQFAATYSPPFDREILNYGAPRDAALELTEPLPEACAAYVRFMLNRAPHTVLKFTRMSCKAGALARIEPDAKFVHIVRDPRAVVGSYLFGKNKRNARLYPTNDVFFDRTSTYTAWSSFPLSELILQQPEYRRFAGCADYCRVLLVWAFTFRSARQGGREAFGSNYMLVRHEDLIADPSATLQRLYDFMELQLPRPVVEWAQTNITRSEAPFAASDPRWVEAFSRLDLLDELAEAGYEFASAPAV